jgi:hypothetical protein
MEDECVGRVDIALDFVSDAVVSDVAEHYGWEIYFQV